MSDSNGYIDEIQERRLTGVQIQITGMQGNGWVVVSSRRPKGRLTEKSISIVE
jgi:hypothetical protein